MWTHLEWQGGSGRVGHGWHISLGWNAGCPCIAHALCSLAPPSFCSSHPASQVKGMGEKQIEVDRRLLKGRMARLRRDIEEASWRLGRFVRRPAVRVHFVCLLALQQPRARIGWLHLNSALAAACGQQERCCSTPDTWSGLTHHVFLTKPAPQVRTHRRSYRERRAAAPIPVVALVGYTNAGGCGCTGGPAFVKQSLTGLSTCLLHLQVDRQNHLLNTLTNSRCFYERHSQHCFFRHPTAQRHGYARPSPTPGCS